MKTYIFLFVFFTLAVTPALAQKKVAIVKLIRGDAELLTLGKTSKLKVDEWVEEGSVVKTSDKSFVKLVFIDKSQMNIGPHSEMKIENFSGKDSGVIDLVKGKIRSQVTKDYLQMEDKNKSKLFIKTKNAVMGVRGTDFMISSNGHNSAVVLFEGEVVFNKLDNQKISNSRSLENIVDRGVRMFPGEFSVVEVNRIPTVPSLLNIQQREHMEKNDSFDSDRGPGNEGKDVSSKSVVPEGLSGDLVVNNSDTIKKEVVNTVGAADPGTSGSKKDFERNSKNPEGFVKGETIKPANGSFLHVDSGVIIPPAPDSVLDKNSNTYMAGSGNGTIAANGDYVPPKNLEITSEGKIMVAVKDDTGATVIKEVPPPIPVFRPNEDMKFADIAMLPPRHPAFLLSPPGADIYYKLPGTFVDPAMDLRLQNQMENVKLPVTNTTIRVKPGE